MGNLRLYAVALSADRDGKEYALSAGAVFAHSEEEAIGYGLEHCRKVLPSSEGYKGHFVRATRISDEYILRAARLLDRP